MKAFARARLFSSRSKVRSLLSVSLFYATVLTGLLEAQAEKVNPVTAFGTRVILVGSQPRNVLFGGAEEGTPYLTDFLPIKETTSDRTVFEFDLRNRSLAGHATIDFRLFNHDVPNVSTLSLYAFDGNGLANAGDYYRTDFFVSSFTGSSPEFANFSLDVTTTYNNFVTAGRDYLGFVIKNNNDQLPYISRYAIIQYPTLTTDVPEPSTLVLGATLALLCSRRTSGCK